MIAGLIAPERPIGGAVGEWIRALLLGLFGLSAFLLPCALIYAGLLNAFGKKDKSYGAKKTAAFVLTIALSGAVHLLAPDVQGTGWAMVEELFAQGQQALGSGGVVGGLLSGALVPMCGTFGALMVYLACMILCAVVLWGITVEGILRSLFPRA